ncbi:hypothetical protein L1987_77850 [Smallanthus sonchifolius]|uniref:Uncharacterized protein n=1 Tax=Smallanthus sonchifolius TaxID=185202 RepID=A0ACB8ZC33_9ASTR|nr:hypothetical protein L1987_77850 [Smallanthus sonchifolius]
MKKRSFTEPKSRGGTVKKKKWDVPKRLKKWVSVEEAGRDSGRAKRVVELVGKRSYFDEEAVRQKLSFDEDCGLKEMLANVALRYS